ncbi:hydantoinase/carbamoylase family amidase [Colletotrichum costaricense]|uniref:Hydantoinase/carbamoylase family amidase n=1 Tax=Colletotrichum costaricense TaxID=1209916 RepID=A0AAI9YTN9_9PEZI|nr:hydantoinase/carbamoylase family amidase [Colletotrichum costaricense]KAK1523851.1 hydantoinase/carbamoylase family amidase [Colletotrichum costaricense]
MFPRRPSAPQAFYFARRSSTFSRGLSGLKINADRLQETIHHTCQWGAAHRYGRGPNETGMARLTLSDEDATARRWFIEETQRLGCDVKVDQMGNIFARQRGSLGSKLPMTAMGSHLDTQPQGGRYDGILGVVAGIEALRTMKENGYHSKFDIGVINWTNEEGARFPGTTVSSKVWAGEIPIQRAWDLRDVSDPSITMKSELERHGYLGNTSCSATQGYPVGAHFELHIEQGPLLESRGRKIGVVRGVQACRWLTFAVAGRSAHSGTTPYSARKDPLLAAAKMIAASNELAQTSGAFVTTGIIKVPPGSSTNAVASQATFTLDIRHPDNKTISEVQDQCLASFQEICRENGVELSWSIDVDSPATTFDEDCVWAVETAANGIVGHDGWLRMTSGATHDSVNTSKHCPTTMIFVPCKDGISHHPEEYCSPEDCALGAQTLLDSVIIYDNRRLAKLQ